MSGDVIRRATSDDAAVLSDVAERAFVRAFGHLYPPADLAQFLHDSYSVEQHAKYLADPKCAMWIARARR